MKNLEVSLVVAFPAAIADKKLVDQNFKSNELRAGIAKVVGRLTGSDITEPSVVKNVRQFKNNDHLFWLVELRNGGATITTVIDFEQAPDIESLAKHTSHQSIQKLLDNLGLKLALSGQVDGVVGLTSNDNKIIKTAPKYWASFESTTTNIVLLSNISQHLVIRVAVERALLTWATNKVRKPLNLVWAGFAGYRVRRWPVELLADREIHVQFLMKLRNQFNLPKVRNEVLERSRSWWTSLASLLALLSLAATCFQTFKNC